ncbi:MAG: acyl-ACP desaturase [Cyclobacteriaceae bacterium]|nr:MAG: acyl-ACP desaturase [Cyclobacteriaceae bacterium]
MDGSRLEVMNHVENFVEKSLSKFLRPVDQNWQPADFLPDSRSASFFDEVRSLQERARELAYDFWAVLIGDTITEEALPTYESWLVGMEGVNQDGRGGWTRWIRGWTAEENRHGDLLNKYLYLSGRVDMRQVEISTQYLLSDGFEIGTGADPYRNFVYTSFQEMATLISHKRVGDIAKAQDNPELARICNKIAADEGRHAHAYQSFVTKILEVDPNEMMLAFADMMKKKIVMPAHYLRELGVDLGSTFSHFSEAAQRLGVYTATDYVDILESLLTLWSIDKVPDLNEAGERARDYLMKLPDRLRRVSERLKIPESNYEYSWIGVRTD